MKYHTIPLILGLFSSFASAKVVGMEMQIIQPKWDDRQGFVVSGSIFNPLPKAYGLLENGIFIKPGSGSEEILQAKQSFGYLLGYLFVPQIKFVRPGMEFGIAYDRWVDANQNEEWVVRPFFGAKVQVSLLSFSASNRGIGAGINLTL